MRHIAPIHTAAAPPRAVEVRITQHHLDSLRRYLLQDGTERVAYLLGHATDERLNVSEVVLPPDDAYVSRSPGNVHLAGPYVTTEVYDRFGQSDCNSLANMHSHPFGFNAAFFSSVDDADDRQRLAHEEDKLPLAKARFGQPAGRVYSFAFVFDQGGFNARWLDRASGGFVPIERMVVLGETLSVVHPASGIPWGPAPSDVPAINLQTLSFGAHARALAERVPVAVVGTGGVGSIAAEMLLRLGHEDLTLIDPDRLEASNLVRFQGAASADVGRPKVAVLRERLLRQFPQARITAVAASVYSPAAMQALHRALVWFGGVDNSAGRAFLSRLAQREMAVVIDGGAQIVAGATSEAQPVWRLAVLVPGLTACADCSPLSLIDHRRAAEEFLDPLTIRLAKAKGYLADQPDEQGAAVYPLNLNLVGAMGLALQNLLAPHRPSVHYQSNVLEFEPAFRVHHEGGSAQHPECWPAQVRVPMGHVHAQPAAHCPHCQPYLRGSLSTYKLVHPACSEQARESRLPDAAEVLARAMAAGEHAEDDAPLPRTVTPEGPSPCA